METKYTILVSTVTALVALLFRLADQLKRPGTRLHSDSDITTASGVDRISEAIAAAERR